MPCLVWRFDSPGAESLAIVVAMTAPVTRLAAAKIEDYAIVGDCATAALISRQGSVDWLCLPRFDSGACFTALLGSPDNGRWLLRPAPSVDVVSVRRQYREGTLVLETEYETSTGAVVAVVDCMLTRAETPRLLRMVEGRRGTVAMQLELVLRFDYGSIVPWVQSEGNGLTAIAGPDLVRLQSDIALRGENFRTVGEFEVAAGQRVSFALSWGPSFVTDPLSDIDVPKAIDQTADWWRQWSARADYDGPHRAAVVRSLITLKALTYAKTGAIVAAPTTSLPEQWGGERNWDYRYCWLRDATFTLYAFLQSGYTEEALAWRDWLLRAMAGRPDQSKVMYSVLGDRRIEEVELPWLAGFHDSKPVRIGNAVHEQLQLDVYGEVSDALYLSRRVGLDEDAKVWALHTKLVEFLEESWRCPDEGIWEVRGPRRDFTHSKVMTWVAFDRAVKMIERFGLSGPLQKWRAIRDEIHADVCQKGYDAELESFVQYNGARETDASLLLIPIVGFLPADDPRVHGTVRLIETTLLADGLVRRYATKTKTDGLPPGEGCFLPCSFWLADAYMLMGRKDEAHALFARLVGLCNDVGLLAEEYDTGEKRFAGNFPQTFSHVSLVNTARNLLGKDGPAKHRGGTKGDPSDGM